MNKIAEELISDGKSYHEAINIVYSKMRELVTDVNRDASSVEKMEQYLDSVNDLNIAIAKAETKQPIDSKVVKAAMDLFSPGGLF